MNVLSTLCFPCLATRLNKQQTSSSSLTYPMVHHTSTSEKQALLFQSYQPIEAPTTDNDNDLITQEKEDMTTADAILDKLFTTTLPPGPALASSLNDLVQASKSSGGWREYIAKHILWGLEAALKAGRKMNASMGSAYIRAKDAALKVEGFVKDHPILVTVIAIGILVILAPYVIEALGFGALGPIEGSWAAMWQATYEGLVPARSLFAYMQRLGMTWKLVPKAFL